MKGLIAVIVGCEQLFGWLFWPIALRCKEIFQNGLDKNFISIKKTGRNFV